MSSPIIWGGVNNNGLLLANPSAGYIKSDATGNLSIQGSVTASSAYNTVAITSAYTAAVNDYVIAGGLTAYTITMPTAVGVSGQAIAIRSSTSSTITINPTGGQSFNVAGVNYGSISLNTSGEVYVLVSNGGSWDAITHETLTPWLGGGAVQLSSTAAYTFTITSATVNQTDVYTNNGSLFTITNSGTVTSLPTSGTGAPTSSGTLTRVSGSGPTTLTYSAVATSIPIIETSPNANVVRWRRQGNFATIQYVVAENGTAGAANGSGDYVYYLPSGLVADANFIQPYAVTGVNMAAVPSAFQALIPGQGSASNSSGPASSFVGVEAFLYSSTSFRVSLTLGNSAGGNQSSTFYQWATSQVGINVTLTVPISGWIP